MVPLPSPKVREDPGSSDSTAHAAASLCVGAKPNMPCRAALRSIELACQTRQCYAAHYCWRGDRSMEVAMAVHYTQPREEGARVPTCVGHLPGTCAHTTSKSLLTKQRAAARAGRVPRETAGDASPKQEDEAPSSVDQHHSHHNRTYPLLRRRSSVSSGPQCRQARLPLTLPGSTHRPAETSLRRCQGHGVQEAAHQPPSPTPRPWLEAHHRQPSHRPAAGGRRALPPHRRLPGRPCP